MSNYQQYPQGGFRQHSDRSGYGGGNGGGNGNNYQYQPQGQHRQPKKHSGSTLRHGWVSKSDGGKYDGDYMIGWNYSKTGGKRDFIAAPRKNGKHKTVNPNWECWAVKLHQQGYGDRWVNGLFDLRTQKLHMPELRMIANPKANNGGYWGKNYKTKN